ncbi:hypothetical protein A5792_06535 [Mycolicibacterium peregrinum]|uniref:Uncharacterized protein n=1 Tax=Mycolicibacterium peregrinum TaxID=43304 RepID=A0A1A0QJS5_MYCPR|nr:hypothetical protein [Mycolicibacterium peregrinum]OBB22163.1 hypothetical protein A5792_06535 [Mycolicibacterium peregrinum]
MTTNKPPPVSEENRKEAERVLRSYDDSRPTVTLPGSHGTVSGTAVNDWVDDDGNPIYGQPESQQ